MLANVGSLCCFFPFVQRLHQTDEAWCLSAENCGPSGRRSWELGGYHACNAWHFSPVRWNDIKPKALHLQRVWNQKLPYFHHKGLDEKRSTCSLNIHAIGCLNVCPNMWCYQCRDLSHWEVSKWDGQIVAALVAARETSSLKMANAGQSYHTFPFRVDHNTKRLPHIYYMFNIFTNLCQMKLHSGWQHFISKKKHHLSECFGSSWDLPIYVHVVSSTLMPGTVWEIHTSGCPNIHPPWHTLDGWKIKKCQHLRTSRPVVTGGYLSTWTQIWVTFGIITGLISKHHI